MTLFSFVECIKEALNESMVSFRANGNFSRKKRIILNQIGTKPQVLFYAARFS